MVLATLTQHAATPLASPHAAMHQVHWPAILLICCVMLLRSAHAAADLPWHLGTQRAPAAPSAINTMAVNAGPHTIVVAVIDSGVAPNHPALSGVLLGGYDMISGAKNLRGGRSTNFAPDERDAECGRKLTSNSFRTHGTEVASVIAGNGVDGMWGVNPKAKILPIRLFGACGMSTADMADAILWAAGLQVEGVPTNPNPARVINISISGGSSRCSERVQNAVNAALEKDIFIVAAAGNNFQRPLAEPANCTGVISVGALSADNRIERYSALDARTSIYSPGGGQPVDGSAPWSDNKLRIASLDVGFMGGEKPVVVERGVGTSYAAPVVAGFISLWLSHHPHKKPSDWQQDFPNFVREVPGLDKCPQCKPAGLAASPTLVQP